MRIYPMLLALIIPVVLSASPFTLLQESQDALTIKFTLPEYSVDAIEYNGTTWNRINCDEGMVHGEEGYPELRVFSTPIAVPVDGDYTVQILSKNSSRLPGINMMPISTVTLGGDDPLYFGSPNFTAYGSSVPYPQLMAEKGESAFVGNRRFIPLMIFPFQYIAQSMDLIINNEITVQITINGTKSSSKNWQISPNPLDAANPPFFLNESTSKSWRKERIRDNSYEAPKNGLNSVNEIQLILDSEGIYKVTYQYLMNLITSMVDSMQVDMNWTPASVDPRYLELTDEYGQVPIHFVGESDGSFDPGDYFEFFGERHRGDTGYMDDFTSENVYALNLKSSYGARMVVENGGLIVSDPTKYTVPDAYQETFHFEEQMVSDKLGQGWTSMNPNFYREDLWFWKKINAPNLDIIPIQLQYPKETTIRTASAKIMLMGLTQPEAMLPGEFDHEASIRLNQAMINTHSWVGQTEKLFVNAAPIPNTFLVHGTNNLYISLSGNTVMGDREQVLLDYAEITYWREYKTDLDYIKFTRPSTSTTSNKVFQFEVSGFSSPDVSVYKIGSSIFNSLQIEPFNIDGAAPWTVSLQDSVFSNADRYYALTEAQKKTPKRARLNIPSDLKNPNNYSEMVIITPNQFVQAEGTIQLKSVWESKGYAVEIVDVQDIYDEFNSGIVGAEPIKDFITYAYNNWSEPQIGHVFLLGEGIDDTRDNSPYRSYNLIPVKKTWTYKHGATASDNWYGCIVGNDTVPDVSVSRLGVWQTQQILDYAAKSDSYHNQPQTSRLWNSHLTLTAGGKITDVDDVFSQQSERIRRQSIPKHYRVTRVYTSTQTVGSDYFGGTFALKDAINTGTQFVQFMGHGGGRIWADYNLFNFNDVATLNNPVYPVVVSLACYASAFDTVGSSSMSEALVLQPGKGAIGAAGFSGLGYLEQDEGWGLAFTEALFMHDFANLGDAMVYALARFYTTTSSSAARYALTNAASYLGDPLIKFRKPISGIPVEAENHVLAPGETLEVSAQFPPQVFSARLYVMKQNEKITNVPFDRPVGSDGEYTATYSNPDPNATNYTRKIYVAGFSPTDEYIGTSVFSVGRPAIMHQELIPANPAWTDSVSFSARVFCPEQVTSMICRVRTDSVGTTIVWVDLPMQASPTDSTLYTTTAKLPAFRTGKEIRYKYKMTSSAGNAESFFESYIVRGPDLLLKDIRLEQAGQSFVLKVQGTNIGNASSTTTDLRLYKGTSSTNLSLFSTQDYGGLAVGEERWDSIDLSNLENNNLFLEVRVNVSNSFPEWHLFFNTNNIINMQVPYNYSLVDNTGASLNSIDNNLICIVPPDLVPAGVNALFAINALSPLNPLNQPDVKSIKLRTTDTLSGNIESVPYDIRILQSGVADTLGIFPPGKRLTLKYHYSVTDTTTQSLENSNSYKIYRYNAEFQKWVLVGGYTNTTENTVSFEVNRTGVYSIFRNTDTRVPAIDVNVQDQEFTVGGYVAGNGVISLLLSDANGIDVIDESIKLYLNGTQIPQEDFVISVNRENINRIPIKYQLNLSRGNHTLVVDCRDLNGYYNTRVIEFVVNDQFDVLSLANYPNPVLGRAQDPKNDGRTRFTYVLTDGADEVTIKVYTVSGRLVRTFSNLPVGVGYHEYPRTLYGWDCKDELGYILANGIYFYRIVARKGNNTIEKTQKMAILK